MIGTLESTTSMTSWAPSSWVRTSIKSVKKSSLLIYVGNKHIKSRSAWGKWTPNLNDPKESTYACLMSSGEILFFVTANSFCQLLMSYVIDERMLILFWLTSLSSIIWYFSLMRCFRYLDSSCGLSKIDLRTGVYSYLIGGYWWHFLDWLFFNRGCWG